MSRKRTTKKSTTTAKRHTQVPSAIKSKLATTTPPPIPATEMTKAAVVTPAAVDSKPVAPVAAVAAAEKVTTAVATNLLALGQSDADIARDAATALGTLGDKLAVDSLIDALKNPTGYFHSVVRAAAASSLGQLGDRRAVEPLLGAIADPSAEVSSESIRALAVLGDARAIDALINVVQNRCGYFLPVTRQAAILALAKLGGERAAGELRKVAASDFEEPAIRHAAKTGIEQGSAKATA